MISIVDYGAGNVASVANALETLNETFTITSNEVEICKADKIIFPGVGEASFAVRQLHKLNLFSMMRMIGKPMLGICLGMQLLCESSKEGSVACLGLFPSTAEKFDETKTKVPHMGWNTVTAKPGCKLFSGIPENSFFYFANSYYVPVGDYTAATAENGILFTAALERGNYYGVQFHPEKSADAGLKLLENFITLC